jgi:hypothetical protein
MNTNTNITRYAIIDNHSGFIWGITDAKTPIDACATIDAEIGGELREYEEVSLLAATTGYHVYQVPADFDVNDGQDQDEIDRVSTFDRVAMVRVTTR